MRDIGDGTVAAVQLATGAPLRSTLDVADPDDWLALDAGVREVAWYRSQFLPEWEHSAPLPVDLTQLGESRLALALCHRDGRIRQEALSQAAPYPGLLPLIVIRCTDWGSPVRERARQLLREVLDVDSALDLAPLIMRVGRRDRGAFGVEVLGEVLRRATRGQLAALFASPTAPCGGSGTGWPSRAGCCARPSWLTRPPRTRTPWSRTCAPQRRSPLYAIRGRTKMYFCHC